MRFLPLIIVSFLFALPAWSLVINSEDAAIQGRFSSGYPNAPIANPNFFARSYDFSGVGWDVNLPNRSVTLISPRHFAAANHYRIPIGNTIRFVNPQGEVHEFTVASYSTTNYEGRTSDLVIGTLVETVTPSTGLKIYPVLDLTTEADYLGLPLLVYGWTAMVGSGEIEGIAPIDDTNDGIDNPSSVCAYFQQVESLPGEAYGQSGDSGSPLFIAFRGQLYLVGPHFAISSTPKRTFSSFIPHYIAQVDAILGTLGYSLQKETPTDPDKAFEIWNRDQHLTALQPSWDGSFDRDADGLVNLLEYALGLDPVDEPVRTPLFTLDYPSPGIRTLSLVRPRGSLAPKATPILESSTDLVGWVDSPVIPNINTLPGGTHESVTYTLPDDAFYRVEIQHTP